MYNYKITTSFASPEMPKSRVNKTGFNIIIVHFYIGRYNTIHDFSGSNPAKPYWKIYSLVDENGTLLMKIYLYTYYFRTK